MEKQQALKIVVGKKIIAKRKKHERYMYPPTDIASLTIDHGAASEGSVDWFNFSTSE